MDPEDIIGDTSDVEEDFDDDDDDLMQGLTSVKPTNKAKPKPIKVKTEDEEDDDDEEDDEEDDDDDDDDNEDDGASLGDTPNDALSDILIDRSIIFCFFHSSSYFTFRFKIVLLTSFNFFKFISSYKLFIIFLFPFKFILDKIFILFVFLKTNKII